MDLILNVKYYLIFFSNVVTSMINNLQQDTEKKSLKWY